MNRLMDHHHGAGLFGTTHMRSSAKIHGYAEDTFFALDSLLALGATGRLSDLHQWQFRARQDLSNPRMIGIEDDDLIAWIYQRRLAVLLQLPELPAAFF